MAEQRSGLRTLDIPFEHGLAQKSDQVWLDPGSAVSAINLVKTKSKSFRKRLGLRSLTTVAYIESPQNLGGAATNWRADLVSGHRLASYRGRPILIGKDVWTDAAYVLNDSVASGTPVLVDRVPEVYVQPAERIAPNLTPGAPITQVDYAITNGLECIVWLANNTRDFSGGNNPALDWHYCVRDAVTGDYVMRPQVVAGASNFSTDTIDAPRVIAVGNTFVLTLSVASGAVGTNNIYYRTFDTTAVRTSLTGLVTINTSSGDSINNGTSTPNAYDIAPVIGDTTKFALLYEATRAGPTRTIRVVVYTVGATPTVVSDTAIDSFDTQWTTDNGVSVTNAQLRACVMRVDSGLGELGYAYAWRTDATLTRISMGLLNYPAMTSKGTAVNLMGTIYGPMSTSDNVPYVLSIERCAVTSNYVTRASPQGTTLDTGASPYIASWQTFLSGAAMAVATNQPRVTFGISLWSRDVQANGIAYLVGCVQSATQGSLFLLADDAFQDTTTHNGVTANGDGSGAFPLRPVANIAPRQLNPFMPSASSTPQSWRVAAHVVQNPGVQGGNVYNLIGVTQQPSGNMTIPTKWTIDFASPLVHQPAELSENLILAGGMPCSFDGMVVQELSTAYYPVIRSIAFVGGGALSAGSYSWMAVFEWTDARGLKHRSGRSVPVTATAGANQTAQLTITCLGFTAKQKFGGPGNAVLGNGPQFALTPTTDVQIKLYRTQVNSAGPYTSVTANDAALASNGMGQLVNNGFFDGASDASIAGNALIYGDGSTGATPGNILDNLCPPPFQAGIVHQNRYFGVDGRNVWPSKVFTSGEGAGFNEATAFSVDDGQNPITALASLDDKLVIFKSDRILYMTGLGPADNGTGNDWSPPARITSDVGAVDWRGVLTTPDGVYFQSALGRRLLTRDLQVLPVPVVEDVDTLDPVVTGAIIHPQSSRYVWTQNRDDLATPRNGQIVTHDYILKNWTTSAFNDGAGHTSVGFVSAVVAGALTISGPPKIFQPVMYLLRADGTMMVEDVSNRSSLDTATNPGSTLFVTSAWTSPWIKSDGLQGWSCWRMVRLTAQVLDPASLTVTIAYNYNSSAVDIRTFTAAQIAARSTTLWLEEIQPTNQRATAMQISISDSSDPTTVTGAGFLLLGLRVDYEYEPGGFRAPVAQRG